MYLSVLIINNLVNRQQPSRFPGMGRDKRGGRDGEERKVMVEEERGIRRDREGERREKWEKRGKETIGSEAGGRGGPASALFWLEMYHY